jgi:hypothetical protein
MKLSVIIIITLSCLFVNQAFSQSDTHSNTMFIGAKVGFNYSNVWDSQGEEFRADSKLGFAIGGFISIPLMEVLSFQPEILFSQKGFQGSGVLLGSNYELTRTSNFLDIPLLVGFKMAPFITILAGPQFSYLMKQTDEFSNSLTTFEQEQEFKNDNIRDNTYGLVGGADVNFDKIIIGARLGWDISNNNGDGTSSTPRYKNTWWQLTAGFRFN